MFLGCVSVVCLCGLLLCWQQEDVSPRGKVFADLSFWKKVVPEPHWNFYYQNKKMDLLPERQLFKLLVNNEFAKTKDLEPAGEDVRLRCVPPKTKSPSHQCWRWPHLMLQKTHYVEQRTAGICHTLCTNISRKARTSRRSCKESTYSCSKEF